MRLLIKNAKLILNNKEVIRSIYIKDGKIRRVANKNFNADKIIDAKHKFVIPGLVDPHVHCREPGLTHKENFFTASKAAAAGGVTTFLDMPNTKPPTLTLKELKRKKALAKKSVVNYGFHFGCSENNLPQIIKAQQFVASTKLFRDATTGNLFIQNKSMIEKIFKHSKFVTTHSEDKNLEDSVKLARKLETRLYLCHISLKSEIDFLKKFKSKNIFCEVTPHHLFLTKKSRQSMKPTLKSESDRKALWNALKSGLIDTIGSDHAPHTLKEKKSKTPPFGIPGLETTLPLLLNAVNKGKLSLTQVVRLTSKNPARIFKLKNKGLIAPGYDADLVIIDMTLEKNVKNNALFTKCGWSPFNTIKLKGWPVITIINGNIVYDNGKINNIKAKEVVYNEF